MFKKLSRNRQLRKVRTGDGSHLQPYRFWQPFTRSVFFIELEASTPPPAPPAVSGAAGELGLRLGLTAPVPAPEYTPPPAPFVPDEPEADMPQDDNAGRSTDLAAMPRYIPAPPTPPAEGEAAPTVDGPASGPRSESTTSSTLNAAASGSTSTYAVDVHFFADDLDGTFSLGTDPAKRSRTPPVALYRDGIQIYRSNQPAAFPVPGGVIEVATSMYGLTRMHYVPADGPERVLRPHPASGEGLRARFGQRFPGLSRIIGAVAVLVLLLGLVLVVPQTLEVITQLEVVAERFGTFTSPIALPSWMNAGLFIAGVLAALERALTLRNHWLIDADTTWSSFT